MTFVCVMYGYTFTTWHSIPCVRVRVDVHNYDMSHTVKRYMHVNCLNMCMLTMLFMRVYMYVYAHVHAQAYVYV